MHDLKKKFKSCNGYTEAPTGQTAHKNECIIFTATGAWSPLLSAKLQATFCFVLFSEEGVASAREVTTCLVTCLKRQPPAAFPAQFWGGGYICTVLLALLLYRKRRVIRSACYTHPDTHMTDRQSCLRHGSTGNTQGGRGETGSD